jgi:receptor expression-enhancing protein 5/6
MNRYSSMRAIESPSTLDDQQWLTYWVLYSFITLFELSFWKVLAWYVRMHVHIYIYIYIYIYNTTDFLSGFFMYIFIM